jgi:hypothetical protein
MAKIETSNFKRLIGIWKTEGTIFTDKGNSKLVGTDSYELILDGHFILHKADVSMGGETSQTFEIISLDSTAGKAKMQYFNAKGESGVMISSLTDNVYKIAGEKLKFEGFINDENTLISGKWFLQGSNNEWIEYIELKLRK